MFVTAPAINEHILNAVLPAACKKRCNTVSMKFPKQKTMQILRYSAQSAAVLSTVVKERASFCAKKIPVKENTAPPISASIMLVFAIFVALSRFLAPKVLESSAFTPTLVPTLNAIISICTGKARDVAVNASSLIFATKILSTML